MTFREIINKNLIFNFRKFSSYFLVNAFVVCILFLFGSLLFNEVLNADPVIAAISDVILVTAIGVIIFSVFFLIYTGYYFVSSRSQEFGLYLTLGMTPKELTRMILLESALIFVAAILLGISGGLLFGYMFYLSLARFIGIEENLFILSYETFLFTLGVLISIFFVQVLAIIVFFRKLSVVKIIKQAKSNAVFVQRPFVGGISLFIFIVCCLWGYGMFTAHPLIFENEAIRNILFEHAQLILLTTFSLFLISIFFVIGTIVSVISSICKYFPRFYQKHLLLFSGLSHKFRRYRTAIFSISLLIAGTVSFLGIALSVYIASMFTLDIFQPHDFMINRHSGMNNISEEELHDLVERAGGRIENILILPYLDGMVHESPSGMNEFWTFRQPRHIVSESDFSLFMGEEFSVATDELLLVVNNLGWDDERDIFHDDVILSIEIPGGHSMEYIFHEIRQTHPDFEMFNTLLEGLTRLDFPAENINRIHRSTVNSHGIFEYLRTSIYVINDEVFAEIDHDQNNSLLLFDLAYGNHEEIQTALISDLLERNGLPEYAWDSWEIFEPILRPISRTERLEASLRANGLFLYAMLLLGVLFLSSSLVILYHKFITDLDEESKNIEMLRKIGLTKIECRQYIKSQLRIVFFMPLVLGGIPGLFVVSRLLIFQLMTSSQFWHHYSWILLMYFCMFILNIALYFALCKNFFRKCRI